MRVVVLLIAVFLLVHPVDARADAAPDIPSSFSGGDADADRTMQGMVDAHAHEVISRWLRANPHRDLTLRLDSPGGSAGFGVKLYRAIAAHGRVSTDVGTGHMCLSACGLIWLGGRARTIAVRAELGFHSAFCTGPCDPRTAGVVNQILLDILAQTEPALAVLVSNTGAMIAGNHLIALAHRDGERWAVRTVEPPTAMAQR